MTVVKKSIKNRMINGQDGLPELLFSGGAADCEPTINKYSGQAGKFQNYPLRSTLFNIFFQRFARYIRAGALLHLVTALGCVFFRFFWGLESTWMFMLCLGSAGMVTCSQLDARSRFQDYKKIKDLLYENGFDTRIISLYRFSRCQRDAVCAAAEDLGLLHPVKRYFQGCGYKKYHIIPEFLFSKPAVLFTSKFWRVTLFARTYSSRYFLW